MMTSPPCGTLDIDQACIVVNSQLNDPSKFLYQNQECDNCTLESFIIPSHQSLPLKLEFVSFGTLWQVSDGKNKTLCSLRTEYFGENSWYSININETDCSVVCDKEPENIFIPIFIALGIFLLFAALWMLGNYLHRAQFMNAIFHRNSFDDLNAAFSSSSSIEEPKPKPQRLRSLDTVRGIAIVIMIFVNYGGGRYTFLHHSRWNGLTVADLVFPWFIWMMGMSMALSLKSQLRKIISKKQILWKIVKRSITLFALGIILNTVCLTVNLRELRIPGVLQRFGICYFVVATIHLFYASADDQKDVISPFRDILNYGGEWLIMLSFLTLHLLLTFLVHSPDCPKGYLGPGGLHDKGLYANCTGGAAGYIDRVLLGPKHIYQNPGPKEIYKTIMPYDPEGINGIFSSIFLVFLGLQAGKILLAYQSTKDRILRWLTWGIIIGLLAGVLCTFSKNSGWIPVNKNLWSVSFIFATGSLAFFLLSTCYLIIDVKKLWSGGPFYHAGMNSIMLYVGHEMTHHLFPWTWQVTPTHMNELFVDLWGTCLWVIIAVRMFYKNIFITV